MSGDIASAARGANIVWPRRQEAHVKLYPRLIVIRRGTIGTPWPESLTATIPEACRSSGMTEAAVLPTRSLSPGRGELPDALARRSPRVVVPPLFIWASGSG